MNDELSEFQQHTLRALEEIRERSRRELRSLAEIHAYKERLAEARYQRVAIVLGVLSRRARERAGEAAPLSPPAAAQ